MTTQFFYFSTNDSKLNTHSHFNMLVMDRAKMMSILLTDTSALLQVAHNRKEPFLCTDLTSSYNGMHSYAIEIEPDRVNSLLQDMFHGMQPPPKGEVEAQEEDNIQQAKDSDDTQKQEERPLPRMSNISERMADHVLDRINKLGLEGITSFDRGILDRYSEYLRLQKNKRRP